MKTYTTYFLIYTALLFSALATASCTKEPDLLKDELEDGYSTVIRDLAGDIHGAMGDQAVGKKKKAFDAFLFCFQDRQQLWLHNATDSARWLQSERWDLAFTGPYNSELFVNNAADPYNPGFEGLGKAQVLVVFKPYAQVVEAPTAAEFEHSEIAKIGWANYPEEAGWFFYSMDSHIMIPIKNKTYLIKTNSGKYAKLELINAYQGNPPEVTNLNWPAPYFTFRYFVQEDGSRNLKTNDKL